METIAHVNLLIFSRGFLEATFILLQVSHTRSKRGIVHNLECGIYGSNGFTKKILETPEAARKTPEFARLLNDLAVACHNSRYGRKDNASSPKTSRPSRQSTSFQIRPWNTSARTFLIFEVESKPDSRKPRMNCSLSSSAWGRGITI